LACLGCSQDADLGGVQGVFLERAVYVDQIPALEPGEFAEQAVRDIDPLTTNNQGQMLLIAGDSGDSACDFHDYLLTAVLVSVIILTYAIITEEVGMVEEIWTTVRLAEASGLTPGRIRQLLIEGEEIHGVKPEGGRDWYVSDAEARRWLAEREVEQA
jgi:hypothetical protein